MSLINTKVKPFKSLAFKDKNFVSISEKEIQGKWNVFFFYPANFTFVCPTELKDLSDHYEDFKKIKTEIYSVSTDTHFSHKVWHDISNTIKSVQYYMISDSSWELTKNFEVMRYSEDDNGNLKESGFSLRATFIIDPDNIIRSIEVISDGVGRNSQELLRKVQALQYIRKNSGEVCPARWEKGRSTLKTKINLVGNL
ncbi:redoxin domain-containing protein [Candidatus Riesia pediculicola]|uniref:Alkyl hydroperoxide reductase C n=1 Tax=Riesia pediculicola (strain USDA) TaxID=515618 RepID=D4G841_RIEPU|nr:redoxin domain-containing protein [Candidatus Riesia pediculicola]ADD79659.1 alkyl hydroperoxide reductase subunit C [Candidatus Riesia pediculicola USDA]ARC53746.1 alkyl hydroperoxide reductase [Candidatus Riesia pediculicola]QOJ86386.1 redoxin domain-containing protein [Candidatus Riesia pediculicola]